MAEELVRNEWGVILRHADGGPLELRWLPTTASMTDGGFMATLCLFVHEAERIRPRTLLIDATEFHHEFGPGVMEWRDENIIPRYGEAGVKKFAFIVSPGFPGTVEAGAQPAVEGSATFPTGWFSTRERAYQWLAEN